VLELIEATLNEFAARVNRDGSSLSAAIKRLRTKARADLQVAQQMQALRRGFEVTIFQA
jgi:hypothetical protein